MQKIEQGSKITGFNRNQTLKLISKAAQIDFPHIMKNIQFYHFTVMHFEDQ